MITYVARIPSVARQFIMSSLSSMINRFVHTLFPSLINAALKRFVYDTIGNGGGKVFLGFQYMSSKSRYFDRS